MLSVTGWYVATAPIDLRCGADRLLLTVQSLGREVASGAAFVFRNRSGTRIKVLVVDATGVWLCTRRLHSGRFVWPRSGDATYELSVQQFEWLCAGIDWQRLSAARPLAKRL